MPEPRGHGDCLSLGVRLRPYLGLLTAGAIAPVAVFGALVAVVLIDQARDTFRDGVQQRTAATITAIDATMEGSIETLQALGAALEVNARDFMEFRTVAERILATQANWSNISLALPSGQQVVNLQRPQGSKLHSIAGVDDSLEIIHRTRQPVVNDIAFGLATQAWDIAVRVPIVRDDEIRYILTGVVRPEAFRGVLASQQLPAGWRGYVIDRKGRVIAAVTDDDREPRPGQAAPPLLQEAIDRAQEGWVRFRNTEGMSRYASVNVSPLTGWLLVVDIPGSVVDAPGETAAAALATGLIAALLAAFALSYVVARRLLKPMDTLARATAAVGRGEPATVPVVRSVAEINALADALRKSVAALQEREELVRREKDALESADRAKTEFIAMLSHELRNPLAALTAAAHLMKVAGASGRTMTQVQGVVERQTEHMAHLIEDLLDISRVTMGKANLQMETFDLGRAVQNLLAVWRAGGRLDRHAVSADTSETWVRADRARMDQVISNLLDNALKFTPAGGSVHIAVRTQRGEALLEVRDTGEGLAPELVARVFGLFVQGPQNIDRRRGGLGIGLALVKRIVEIHDGRVEAASEGRGEGALFRVRLPAVAAPATRPNERGPVWQEKPRPLRILLVEDNEDARHMVSAALAHAGHEVREAADGASALAQAKEVKPDAILLDIGLPDIDGYEVARRLRNDGPARDATLIALTGYGQKEDRERCEAAGFDAHLIKPVAPDALQKVLLRTRSAGAD